MDVIAQKLKDGLFGEAEKYEVGKLKEEQWIFFIYAHQF